MRAGLTSTPRNAAPFIVAASGCAPPMPPSPAETTSRPARRAAEVPARAGGERLVGALQDALRADVDPAAGGHLAVHRQAHRFEPAKLLPGRPFRHEQAVGDQHARRQLMRAHHADRLAGLHEQGLVVFELAQGGDDGVERFPACAPPCRCRRRRRGGPGPRPPRDRGCSSACAGRLPESSPCRCALAHVGHGSRGIAIVCLAR